MRRFILSAIALVLVSWCAGCAAFRAEVGHGVGLGVQLGVPAVLHTGLGGGQFEHLGHNYRDGWRHGNPGAPGYDIDAEFALVVAHWSEARDRFVLDGGAEAALGCFGPSQHACVLVPVAAHPGHASSYGLEVSAALLFFDLRLGFNPWYWFHDAHWEDESDATEAVDLEDTVREGLLLIDEGTPQEALAAVDAGLVLAKAEPARARRQAESVGRLWYLRGLILFRLAHFEPAADAFTAALEVAPGNPYYLAFRANARFEAGQVDRALEDAEAALRSDANCADAYVARSLVRATRGDRDGAAFDFKKALEATSSVLGPGPDAHAAYKARLAALGVKLPD